MYSSHFRTSDVRISCTRRCVIWWTSSKIPKQWLDCTSQMDTLAFDFHLPGAEDLWVGFSRSPTKTLEWSYVLRNDGRFIPMVMQVQNRSNFWTLTVVYSLRFLSWEFSVDVSPKSSEHVPLKWWHSKRLTFVYSHAFHSRVEVKVLGGRWSVQEQGIPLQLGGPEVYVRYKQGSILSLTKPAIPQLTAMAFFLEYAPMIFLYRWHWLAWRRQPTATVASALTRQAHSTFSLWHQSFSWVISSYT